MAKATRLLSPQVFFKLFIGVIPLCGLILVMAFCYRDYQVLIKMGQANTNGSRISVNNLPSRELSILPNGNVTKREQLALLFGQQLTQTTKPINKSPPDTRLNLILQGTYTNATKNKSRALIAQSKQSSKNYLIGDEIISGVKLIDIHPGKVILRRNGQDESLKMPILKGESQFRPRTLGLSSDTSTPEYSTDRNPNQYSANIKHRLKRARAQVKANLVNNEELD